MSGITLTSAVRQNLLSLQSTAELLSTTQSRLATGKKVNSALDNPTNFFTAASLDARASDINNLLDGIGNGVQILQAANTGITSLQKLVDTAKSIANQALQTQAGYTKSSVTAAAIEGATANNLLAGSASATNAAATGTTALTPIDLRGTAATNAALTSSTSFTGVNLVGTPAGNAVLSGAAFLDIDLTGPAATNAVLKAGSALTGIDLTGTPATNATTTTNGFATVDTRGTYGVLNLNLSAGVSDAAAISFEVNGTEVTLAAGGAATGNSWTAAEIANAISAALTTDNNTTVVASDDNGTLTLTSAARGGTVTIANSNSSDIGDTTNSGTAAAAVSFQIGSSTITLAAGGTYNAAAVASEIETDSSNAFSASVNGDGEIVITSNGTAGSSDSFAITGGGVIGATNTTFTGQAAAPAAPVSFKVNGATVTLTGGSDYTAANIVSAINTQVGTSASVSAALNSNGELEITSTGTAGASDEVIVDGFSGTHDASLLGFAAGTSASAQGAAAGTGTAMSFQVNGTSVTLAAGSTYSGEDVASAIAAAGQGKGFTATYDADDGLVITSTGTPGSSDSIDLTNFSGGSASTIGLSTSSASGTAANPAADLVFTVNGETVTLAGGTNHTGAQVAAAITAVGEDEGFAATFTAGEGLRIVSTGTAGADDELTVAITSGGNLASLGLSTGSAEGADAVPATDLTFEINGQEVVLEGGAEYDADAIADAINEQVGESAGVVASVVNGVLTVTSSGTAGAGDNVLINNFSSGDATQLGFATAAVDVDGTDATGMAGKTLTIASTAGGTATEITFGTGAGEINTLDQLNAALASNNLMATISKAGVITITTTNDNASANIGAIGGTAVTDEGAVFSESQVVDAVKDPVSQATRASLVDQYNKVIEQIVTTAQDASFNGVNLLNGDQLKLVFNETGKSTLSIAGVNFGPEGLGLEKLTAGADFVDNANTNKILEALNTASTTLRSQASAFGSNLSVVQIRQDFSKNLINVLQTGAANLTLADTNEEAANSQALSTRQSIAVSALSLANQSQQSVLQLLR